MSIFTWSPTKKFAVFRGSRNIAELKLRRKLIQLLRITGYAASGLVSLLIITAWAIRFPYFQQKLVPVAEEFFSSILETEVSVGSVAVVFPVEASLDSLLIRDQKGLEMIRVGSLRVNLISLSFWQMVFGSKETREIGASGIELNDAELFLYRSRADSVLNASFLLNKDSTPEAAAFYHVSLPEVGIHRGRIFYIDSTAADSVLAITGRLNKSNFDLPEIEAEFGIEIDSSGSMEGVIRKFSFEDMVSGIGVDSLTCKFVVQKDEEQGGFTDFSIRNLLIRKGATRMDFDAGARVVSVASLFDSVPGDSVNIRFRRSVLDFEFAQKFTVAALPVRGLVSVSGPASWAMNRLASDSLQVGFGSVSKMLLGLRIDNYMDADEMNLDVNMKPAMISFEELKDLLPGANIPLAGKGLAEGRIRGDLHKLRSNDFRFVYGENTRIDAKVRLTNLLHPNDLVMEIEFRESYFTMRDLERILPGKGIPSLDPSIGRIDVDGRLIGGLQDFVVDATVRSGIGFVTGNMQMILPPKAPLYEYHGHVVTRHFDLNRSGLFPELRSSELNFDGYLDGAGFRLAEMNTVVHGFFSHSEFFGETLDSLWTDSLIFRKEQINGVVTLNDREGDGHLTLDMDMASSPAKYILVGDVERLNLAHYGVTKDSLRMRSVVNVNLKGDSLEEMGGRAKFFLLEFANTRTKDTLNVDDLTLKFVKTDVENAVFDLSSTIFDFSCKGKFNLRSASSMVARMGTEAKYYLLNNDSLTAAYYGQKIPDSTAPRMQFESRPGRQVNEAMRFLGFDFYFSSDLFISGDIRTGEFDEINIGLSGDSLTFFGIGLKTPEVSLNMTKLSAKDSLIAVGILGFRKAKLAEGLEISDLSVEATIINNMVEYYASGSQPEFNNNFRLFAQTVFQSSGVLTSINEKNSMIRTGSGEWKFKPGNLIVSAGSKIAIRNLELRNENQFISIGGILSSFVTDTLRFAMGNIPFATIREVHTGLGDFDGTLDDYQGQLVAAFGHAEFTGKGSISEFRFKMVEGLDIQFRTSYRNNPVNGHVFGFRSEIFERTARKLVMFGHCDFNNKQSPLYFEIDSSHIPMRWIQPFTEGMVERYRGMLEIDHFVMQGRADSISLTGEGHFAGEKPGEIAGAYVAYLGKDFSLGENSVVGFNRDQIIFREITLFDSDTISNHALLNGDITHHGLKTFEFDLQMTDAVNFECMNTTVEDNELFYGRMVIETGIAIVTGDLNTIELTANVVTGAGTNLNIPVTDYTSAERLDFVTFTGSGAPAVKRDSVHSGALALNLNVDLTEDARVRMIFDEQVGDIIEVVGNGTVNVELNEHGEMQMRGTYETVKGNYLFTAQNVVNKRFDIQKGGKITWSGDPYEAELDLSAVYKVKASLKDLLGEEYQQRIPVQIIMKMTGSLANPDVKLSIEMDQLTQQDVAGVSSYFRNIQYDEQELNNQVVSLLLFGRFAPTSNSQQNNLGGVALTNSISELISNQLNYWLSQSMGTDNFGVEVKTNQFEDVQVGIKAAMFNDRVTFESNGTLVGNKNSNVSIGNLSVQIKLLPPMPGEHEGETVKRDSSREEHGGGGNPGQMVMEIFRRESNDMTNNSSKTGLGVFYKKEFDHINELFGMKHGAHFHHHAEEKPDL